MSVSERRKKESHLGNNVISRTLKQDGDVLKEKDQSSMMCEPSYSYSKAQCCSVFHPARSF